jgi:D-alanyl-D-alanine carboxypeptidase
LAILYFHGSTGTSLPVSRAPAVETASMPRESGTIDPAPLAPLRIYLPRTLHAQAAVVYDIATHTVLYDQRANEALPLASLTKLTTALAARSLLAPTDSVPITARALAVEGFDSLQLGEVWSAKNLTDYMLIVSSNRAARALRDAAEKVLQAKMARARTTTKEVQPNTDLFIEYMNSIGARLDMSHTTYSNESGLDIRDSVATNFGSARDVATLLAYIIEHEPDLVEATKDDTAQVRSLNGGAHKAVSPNKALSEIPGLIAGKTGFTDVAGGNLAIVLDVEQGHPVAIVVLGSGKDERFTDILTLVESTRSYFGLSSKKDVALPI